MKNQDLKEEVDQHYRKTMMRFYTAGATLLFINVLVQAVRGLNENQQELGIMILLAIMVAVFIWMFIIEKFHALVAVGGAILLFGTFIGLMILGIELTTVVEPFATYETIDDPVPYLLTLLGLLTGIMLVISPVAYWLWKKAWPWADNRFRAEITAKLKN